MDSLDNKENSCQTETVQENGVKIELVRDEFMVFHIA